MNYHTFARKYAREHKPVAGWGSFSRPGQSFSRAVAAAWRAQKEVRHVPDVNIAAVIGATLEDRTPEEEEEDEAIIFS